MVADTAAMAKGTANIWAQLSYARECLRTAGQLQLRNGRVHTSNLLDLHATVNRDVYMLPAKYSMVRMPRLCVTAKFPENVCSMPTARRSKAKPFVHKQS